MNKKSKVTNVQPNGTWEGKFGMMYKFEVSFENGDTGEYSSKSQEQNKFIVGNDTDYEFIDGKFPKVKPVWLQQQTQFTQSPKQSTPKRSDDVQDLIVRQSSLKAAVDFCDSDCTVDHIISNAEVFYDWVMRNEKTNNNNNNNDIPF